MKHLLGNVGAKPLGPFVGEGKALRFSIDRDDPGYAAWDALRAQGRDLVIYLDGVRTKVVTADVAEGFVVRPCRNERGELFHYAGDIATEIVRGEVRIEIIDRA